MTLKLKVLGTKKLINSINKKEKRVINIIARKITQSGSFVAGEVKLSIAGHRAEKGFRIKERMTPKGIRGPIVDNSVDKSGFINSIYSRSKGFTSEVYSNVKYATMLEYGDTTKKRAGRRHFRNSLKRNSHKVKGFIEKAIKMAI